MKTKRPKSKKPAANTTQARRDVGRSIDSQTARAQHAEDAFKERVYWHTLAIVNLATLELPQQVANSKGFRSAAEEPFGTGAAVMWKGHELILTAAHVLEGAAITQIALMPRPASSFKELVPGSKLALQRRIKPRVKRIVTCDWEDLAFIELEEGEARGLRIRFADIARSRSPHGGTPVAYLGHPFDSTYEVARVQHAGHTTISKAVGPMMTAGRVSFLAPKEAQYYRGFDSERHFMVEFPPADVGTSGRGFSGTGFWYFRKPPGIIWEPRARLAGICTHQYVKKKLLKGVKMECVRTFLNKTIA
jgi:hypothetical protein